MNVWDGTDIGHGSLISICGLLHITYVMTFNIGRRKGLWILKHVDFLSGKQNNIIKIHNLKNVMEMSLIVLYLKIVIEKPVRGIFIA